MQIDDTSVCDLIDELREIRQAITGIANIDDNELNDLLRRALEKWGYGSQALIWIEEMAELTKEIAKRDRLVNPSNDDLIAEELADVDLCLDQMKLLFPKWKKYKAEKVNRLKGLLQRG